MSSTRKELLGVSISATGELFIEESKDFKWFST